MFVSSVVAVAGGTGGVGRAIVEAILADGKQDVIILARQSSSDKEKEIGAKILPVNYTDVEATKRILEENNIDTVISTLGAAGVGKVELDLVVAADRASTTKRYIASNWGVKYPADVQDYFPPAKDKANVIEALEKSSLEFTSWFNGIFADYFVSPPLKSYLPIIPPFIDIPNEIAAIPGSGHVPVAFTYTLDLARFVSASLSSSDWPRETLIYGGKLTLNQLVRVLENYKGHKFKITYDEVNDLKAGKITELPSHQAVYPFFPKEMLQSMFGYLGLWSEQGLFDLEEGYNVAKSFSHLKARTIEELLEKKEK